jgi:CheY-like chemotaxis protein
MGSEEKKILFLEDDGDSMLPLKDYLESKGWSVELTANAGILDRLARECFDLMLVDLMIYPEGPEENGGSKPNVQYAGVPWEKTGLEFIKRLRSGEYKGKGGGTPPNVPVIVLSAVANETAEEELENMELASRYIEKPFKLSVLKNAIEELLRGS